LERTLRIDPKDSRPIWRQIEEGVRHLVACGSLAAGTGVPSVRDLARELGPSYEREVVHRDDLVLL